ncbi:MAG: PLP-dependent aminotransferase family protein [Chloroflexi bacterium]|nr:PLP-dependent aminotransferase family protein [Chloroflexota bacterium]
MRRTDPNPGTLQRRLYDRLRSEMLGGQLAPGQRLCASRELAATLGLSRTTVVSVYEQLHAEGYLEARQGSGTFVTRHLPAETPRLDASQDGRENLTPTTPSTDRLSRWGERLRASARLAAPTGVRLTGIEIDFRPGQPDWAAFPREVWRRLSARRWLRGAEGLASYGEPAGYRRLREEIAAQLGRSRGVRCTADQVVVISGSQQGTDLVARLWLEPGEAAALEEPGYAEAALALRAYGVYVLPVPVDEAGLCVDRLPDPAAPQAPRLVYATPSHQFPTGATLSLRRRLDLLDWAARRGALLLEDDYDSELRYDGRPLESLQGLDEHGVVVYLGSFSVPLFPPLRIGYLVLPPRLVEAAIAAKWLADRQTGTPEQQVLADFMAEGHYERHLRRMRRLYGARRDALVSALHAECRDLLEPVGYGAGLHLAAWLRPGLDESRVVMAARERGVGVYPLRPFYHGFDSRPGLLLGFAALDEARIAEGARRLAAAMQPLSSRE